MVHFVYNFLFGEVIFSFVAVGLFRVRPCILTLCCLAVVLREASRLKLPKCITDHRKFFMMLTIHPPIHHHPSTRLPSAAARAPQRQLRFAHESTRHVQQACWCPNMIIITHSMHAHKTTKKIHPNFLSLTPRFSREIFSGTCWV